MENLSIVAQREAGLPKVFGVYQLAMVAVGAIVSYGLLSGASLPLMLAGPGVIFSYLAASVIVLLMAFCLSEMVANRTMPGAFASYAEAYLGRTSGFMVRSAYVSALLLIIGTEIELLGVAAVHIAPGTSKIAISLLGLALIAGVNLAQARWFARLGYVFSAIKIVALLGFVSLTWLFLSKSGNTPLAAFAWHPELLPTQNEGVWQAFVLAVLGYAGMETLAVAAGETAASGQVLRRVIRRTACLVVALILTVVVSSVALWDSGELPFGMRPTTFLLQQLGMSDRWFQALVAIAVLSVINSQLYTVSRMLFSLGSGQPRLRRLSQLHRGCPRVAVTAAAFVSLLVYVALQLYTYETFLVATSIAASCWLLVWLMIFWTYLKFRKQEKAHLTHSCSLPAWPAWCGGALVLLVVFLTWELALFYMTLQIGVPFITLLWLMNRFFLLGR